MRSSYLFSRISGGFAMLSLVGVAFGGARSMAAPAAISAGKSTVAIVTQKEGIASGLAHRHIIVGANWTATLDLRKDGAGKRLEGGVASVSIPASQLIVDSPDAARGIVEVLRAGKVWDPSTDKLSPENAEKVRENMIAESQLAVDKFPLIEGRGTFASCQKVNEAATQCTLDLVLKVRDRAVTKNIPVTIRSQGGELVAEFLGKYKFTEFAIKPYTAMMGAIAVSDEFVLAGRLVAPE